MAPVLGFDFDECLAHVYTILPFALLLERLLPRSFNDAEVSPQTKAILQKGRDSFYELVALNEVQTKGTLFRPAMLKVLPRLLQLRQQGKIERLFIYSNNEFDIILNMVDHILALTLLKEPYKVSMDTLVKENNTLHVLTPRIHLDGSCRASETKDKNHFREKSFEGIKECLGLGLSENDLWFLDDKRYHTNLMNHIKNHYVVVKPYNVKVSNKVLSEILIKAFPLEAFIPGTNESKVFLTQLQILLPNFYPSGRETQKTLLEKLTKEIRVFSPLGSGYLIKNWKEADISADVRYIETSLRGLTDPVEIVEPSNTVRRTLGGKQTRKKRKTNK